MRFKSLSVSSDVVLYQNYQYQKFKSHRALFFKLRKNKKVFITLDEKRISFFVHDRWGYSLLNKFAAVNITIDVDSVCAKNFLKWYYRKLVPNQPGPLFDIIKVIHTLQFSYDIVKSVVLAFYRTLCKHFYIGSSSVKNWVNRVENLKTESLMKVFIRCQPRSYFEPFCSFSEKIHLYLNTFCNGVPFLSQWKVIMLQDKLRIYLSSPIENVVYAKYLNFNPIFMKLGKALTGAIQFCDHKELWLSLYSNTVHQYLFITFEDKRLRYYDTIRVHSETTREKTLHTNVIIVRTEINRHCNISHHHTYVRPCLLTFSRSQKTFEWVQLNHARFSDIIHKSVFKGCYSFYQDFLIVVIPLIRKFTDTCHKFLLFALHPISLKNLRPPKLVQLSDFDPTSQTAIFDVKWDKATDVASISYIGYHGVYFQTTDSKDKRFFPLPCYPINYAYDATKHTFYYPFHSEQKSGIKAIKIENEIYLQGSYETNEPNFPHENLKIDSMNDVLYVIPPFEPNQNNDQQLVNTYKTFTKISTHFTWSPIIFHSFSAFNPIIKNN